MIDDHDRCKWVHVSSGTCSPGLSRIKSRKPYNGDGSSSLVVVEVEVEQALTSHQTHYRSYQGQVSTGQMIVVVDKPT